MKATLQCKATFKALHLGKQTKSKKTQQKLETEEHSSEKVAAERNKIIQDLVEKSALQEEEKKSVLKELKKKEDELSHFQNEITKLEKRLLMEKMENRKNRNKEFMPEDHNEMFNFTLHVIRRLGGEKLIDKTASSIRHIFKEIFDTLPNKYIKDLNNNGLLDENLELTNDGIHYFKDIARKYGM